MNGFGCIGADADGLVSDMNCVTVSFIGLFSKSLDGLR